MMVTTGETTMKLVLGNKAFSTWSLRPWLVLKRCGAKFQEVVIPLYQAETADSIAQHSPSGRVPVLEVEGVTIWDSMAISVWAAERYPQARLWPSDAHARWVARSAACEMHAGFPVLREECGMGPDHPMVGPPGEAHSPSPELAVELRRLVALWRDARDRFGAAGPYLFGEWSVPDAFFTPVAARIRHYRLNLTAHGDDGAAQAYVDVLLKQPDFLEWEKAGLAELA
jgi:glutathione S-transferase